MLILRTFLTKGYFKVASYVKKSKGILLVVVLAFLFFFSVSGVRPFVKIYQRQITTSKMTTKHNAVEIWQQADTVCFDVDSTLIQDEGLDELANFCGVGKIVKEWTNKAMGEGLSFRVALSKRLDIIQPSHEKVKEFIKQHPIKFSPGIRELISILHRRGTAIYLVSGGFDCIIEPAAKVVGISSKNIFANRLRFYFNGDYAGFDESQPTSSSGGKAKVAEILKESSKKLVFVGDGVTDMETSPIVDLFIGYGGNVVRQAVKEKSDWFVTDFQDLIQALSNPAAGS